MKLLSENKRKKLNNNGITLIALVITTVILLILAVVGISLVNDDRGLFGMTDEAVFKTKMGQIAEQYNMYKTSQIMNAITTGTKAEVVNAGEILKTIVQNKDYEIDIEETSIIDIHQVIELIRSGRTVLNGL